MKKLTLVVMRNASRNQKENDNKCCYNALYCIFANALLQFNLEYLQMLTLL